MQDNYSAKQPLLTIAIPTYNRAAFLDLCLKRISEEIDSMCADKRDLVKVYVSNNASTDNTTEIISRYQSINAGRFEVVLNAKNIGGESNVAQCYAAATTPYVWVLGDDDVILESGLATVLNVLRQQDLDILSVGCKSYVDSYDEKVKFAGSRIDDGITVFSSAVPFTRRTNVNLTFISSLIVRSGCCNPDVCEVVKGSNLPQMCWVSSLLRNGKLFATLDNLVIAAKANNSGGFSLVQVFGKNLQELTTLLLGDRPLLAKIIQNGTIVNCFTGAILSLRNNQGNYTMENDLTESLKSLYGGNWKYYIFLLPLISLPLFAAKTYYFFLRVLRRILLPILI